MKIEEALPLLEECVGIRFEDLFADLPDDLRTNKGNVGQLLLKKIGLNLDSNLKDFDNGELKTNKSDAEGNPIETMFITQISRQIDSYISESPLEFEKTDLYEKIKNLVFLPVCKEPKGNNREWFFVSMHHVNLESWDSLRQSIENDYISICNKMRTQILDPSQGKIETSSGQFIQIRTKDSRTKNKDGTKSYHPIHSQVMGRKVSHANYAFYFKKEFMKFVRDNDRKL